MRSITGLILFLGTAGLLFGNRVAVVSPSGDSFLSLARDIAAEIDADLLEDFPPGGYEALVVVARPEYLTRERMTAWGNIFRDRDWFPSTGIITGSSLESARELWQRGTSFPRSTGLTVIAGDTDKNAGIYPGRIRVGGREDLALNRENMTDTLAASRFFYWSRHVSKRRLYWYNDRKGGDAEDGELTGADVPELNGTLVYAPACGSVAPWYEGNIALSFLEKGASAYAGHLYSPMNSGMFMGDMVWSPGENSWPGFPLGLIVQQQNRASAGMIFRTPNFFLLGSPFLYARETAPYRVREDRTEGASRHILIEPDFPGIIPVKIEGGAGIGYVKMNRSARLWSGQKIFNKSLHMLASGDDLYLLCLSSGESISLELRQRPPLLFPLFKSTVDSLDYVWVWLGASDTPLFLIPLFAALVILAVKGIRGKIRRGPLLAGFLYSLFAASYFLIRRYNISATIYRGDSRWYAYLPLWLASGACFAAGLLLFSDARRRGGKILAFLFSLFPLLMVSFFICAAVAGLNLLILNQIGQFLWNGTIPLMLLRVLVISGLFFFLATKSPSLRP